MLALLFDMNNLWEEYILARLKQSDREITVYGQQSNHFWNGISIRPDIVLDNGSEKFIIDTKWKNISYSKPSTHDLRQMYVYNDYWVSTKAMLLYPSNKTEFTSFVAFEQNSSKKDQHECGLGKISIFKPGATDLNDKIGNEIIDWFKSK
jgi:5-methylcytosine-specific restriction enzyme subunit McrC